VVINPATHEFITLYELRTLDRFYDRDLGFEVIAQKSGREVSVVRAEHDNAIEKLARKYGYSVDQAVEAVKRYYSSYEERTYQMSNRRARKGRARFSTLRRISSDREGDGGYNYTNH
jgi:hypothetical protein